MLRGDLLDVHAALGRRHHRRRGRCRGRATSAEVELARDVEALLDEQALDLLALGAGLVRDQLHAEDLLAAASRVAAAPLATLTPPPLPRPPAWICALTTTTSVPVSLLHASDGGLGLVDASNAGMPFGHRHAVLREELLALVLVDLHVARCITATGTIVRSRRQRRGSPSADLGLTSSASSPRACAATT